MIATACEPFTEFLKTQLKLEDHEVPEPGEWANVGNTTGALALRLNVLTVDEIDQILEAQENCGSIKMFGELAIEMGFLDSEQVDRLLSVQQLNKSLELGEQLVISGKTDIPTLLTTLENFLRRA